MITHSRLTEVLRYDLVSGQFFWKKAIGRAKAGDVAGRIDIQKKRGDRERNHPYSRVIIQIDGREYKAHRLAYFWVFKTWPEGLIDHKDRNPTNNRFLNLRDVSHRVNVGNRVNSRAHKCASHMSA